MVFGPRGDHGIAMARCNRTYNEQLGQCLGIKAVRRITNLDFGLKAGPNDFFAAHGLNGFRHARTQRADSLMGAGNVPSLTLL